MRKLLRILVLLVGLVLVPLQTNAQESNPIVTWQALVNQVRLDEGLAPYGLSTLLTAAAQRHADDLAAHQIWSHTGSDDSTPQRRIADAGYAAWIWSSGETITGENFWTGYGTIEDAMAFFLEDPPHRDNILNSTYREIGIGVGRDAAGRNYYVLDFGARPNVLPIFINDGAANADDPHVAIRLTNETARPEGSGATFMGQAIEIRISNEPDFGGQPWQRWEPLVPWTLPDGPGEHTVYVQFRDAAGRTAASADAIILGEATPAPISVSPSPEPEPTATSVPASPTPEPTATPVPASPTPEPTITPDLAMTATPEPAAALVPTFTPTPEPSPTTEPTRISYATRPWSPPPDVTPFPTWTPLPTAAPPQTSKPHAPVGLLAVLQGMALMLGVYLVLRRGRVIRNP